jgi:hypothetical protein
MEPSNPPITKLLRGVTAFEIGVLIVSGGGLFFLPAIIGPMWPWPLTPFNTAMLGALYLGSLVAAAALVRWARWSPARVVLPSIAVFTLIVLIVSILYLDRFNQQSISTLFWFLLYLIIPVNALYHLWLYRKLPPANPTPPASPLRQILLAQAIGLGFYGIGLLVAPMAISAFWPWPLDDFHGRMYSVAFLTPAVGSWLLWRASSALELMVMGLTQALGGVLAIAGLLVVDAQVHRVDWTQLGTWLWIGISIVPLIIGVWMVWQGRARQQSRS